VLVVDGCASDATDYACVAADNDCVHSYLMRVYTACSIVTQLYVTYNFFNF
jgi:hypothetical protein